MLQTADVRSEQAHEQVPRKYSTLEFLEQMEFEERGGSTEPMDLPAVATGIQMEFSERMLIQLRVGLQMIVSSYTLQSSL